MLGKKIINTGSVACTTDTTQILDGGTTQSIATYRFEDNANDVTTNYNGTASGVTYAAGKFDKAAVFNGSSSYINTNIPASVFNNYTWSISMWLKHSDTDFTYFAGTTTGNTVLNGMIFGIYGDGSRFDFIWRNASGTASRFQGGSLAINTWTNIVVTSNNNSIRFYQDGSLMTAYSGYSQPLAASSITHSQPFDIGRAGTKTTELLDGMIDQVRIFSTALGPGEVNSLYNETTTTAALGTISNPSTVAYYKMQDATDETGSYNGTASNVDFNVEGKYGFAGKFNGSSSKINLGNQTFFNSGNFSVSFWFKNQGNDSAYQMLFSQRTSADAGSPINISMYGVSFGSNPGKLYFAVGGSYIISNTALAKNVWHHVVCTIVASGAMKIYVNGSLDSNAYNETTTRPTPTNQNLAIGANGSNNTYSFNGGIDQVRIFNKAISATEVTKLYNEIQCADTIATPESYFNTALYTGDNNTTQAITNVGFQPDLVWIKQRSGSASHTLQDSIRGVGQSYNIYSDNTASQGTYGQYGYLSSFNTNGFTVTKGSGSHTNAGSSTYTSWNWKAASSNTTNNDGTVQTTVRASQESGFSVVTHTSPSGAYTWGHGLSKTPELWIHKATNYSYGWETLYPDAFGTNNTDLIPADWNYLRLDTTAAASNSGYSANNTVLSSTGWGQVNNFVTYCFHSVDGYQRIGSYVGTASTGPFVYTGFEPAWLMIKEASNTGNWLIYDNKRDTVNPNNVVLAPNSSNAESSYSSGYNVNFHTNGFEIAENASNDLNTSGSTYIFMAIAANPDTTAPTKANSFKTKTFTSNNGAQSITGVSFKPDFVWTKSRTNAYNHSLYDSVRGVNKLIQSNTTNAQSSVSNAFNSFDSDGFTLGSSDNSNNGSGNSVSWNWKALDHDRNLAAINTDGTIPSILSANPAAGFSVVKFNGGQSSGATVGHSLSSDGTSRTPELIIVKNLDKSSSWVAMTQTGFTMDATTFTLSGSSSYLSLNSTTNFISYVYDVQLGGTANGGASSDELIAYCFTSVAGYSKIGTYSGNGTANHEITNVGFQPSFLIIKNTGNSGTDWLMYDNMRGTTALAPNQAFAESTYGTSYEIEFISNGFKIIDSNNATNQSGTNNMLYMAFK